MTEQSLAEFKSMIEQSGAVDPVGVHSEFRRGDHGRKIDFAVIEEDPVLFERWVNETAEYIEKNYDEVPELLVGVADGTNKLVEAVAHKLQTNYITTEKIEDHPEITDGDTWKISKLEPGFALVVEDTGTTGFSSEHVVDQLKQKGIEKVEVLNTWQRNPELICLIGAGVVYKSLIVDYESVETFEPNDCRLCDEGWKLIERPKA